MDKVCSLAITILLLVGFYPYSLHCAGDDKIGQDALAVRERIGSYIPRELELFDEQGNPIPISSLLGKTPLILILVYYRCPSVCTLILNGIAGALERLPDYTLGRDFQILTLSFDPRDTPSRSREKKENYLRFFTLPGDPVSGWRFFTAASTTIEAITRSVGYPLLREGEEYIHPAVLIFLTAQGEIKRYLYGVEYTPEVVRLALLEAGMRPRSLSHRITKVAYCYRADLSGYGPCASWIRGGALFLLLILFLLFLSIRKSLKGDS